MTIPKDKVYEIHGVTPPDLLGQIASELPDVPDIDLSDYSDVICLLHDQKDYSFKKIVEFLHNHGVETNRSAVYRVYKDTHLPIPADDPLVDEETGEIVEQ
jgi:hypothetical protein